MDIMVDSSGQKILPRSIAVEIMKMNHKHLLTKSDHQSENGKSLLSILNLIAISEP